MVFSMTGFGRGQYKTGGVEISVEIRSVNHRYNDISIKMPRFLSFLEERIRQYIQSRISRGRVDVYISYEELEQDRLEVVINKELAHRYMEALSELKEYTGLKDDIDLSLLTSFPEVITVEQKELDEERVWQQVSVALEQAVDILVKMRKREGENLKRDILERLKTIDNLVSKIEGRSHDVVLEYKQKLEKRVEELARGIDIDRDRLYQEVVIFADRSNITEEIVRLRSHISQMNTSLEQGGIIGRKLDFLAQEMYRESNTIASKASDLYISTWVVEIKSELEKVREQIQNIE